MQQAAESSSLIGIALEERYQILREIGRGGMGIVYEAEHVELGKRVAIKVMLDKYANDDEAVARFKREALAASRIGNPHIIDVAHIGATPDGRPFVAMELLDGEPLATILQVTGPMMPWRAIHIMRQVLRAVGAAHAKGIIHRDLKPDNIFIVNRDDEHDFVKLLDFGISKIIDTADQMGSTRLTTTGTIMGTPLYMAPEQATGAPAERGVDIYACGVILFEMLSGRPPFNETNYNLLIAKLLTASPPLLSDLRKGLPGSLVAAVHRALEKDPEQRFPTAEAFAQALPSDRAISEPNLEILDTLPPGSPGASQHVTPPSTVPPAASHRGRWVLGGVLALAGVGAIVAAVILGKGDKPSAPAIAAVQAAPSAPPPAPAPAPPAIVPETGKLEIETIPSGATVRVDNRDVGSTPIEVTLPHGRHKLHVERQGFTAIDTDQDVHTSERTTTVITLLPKSSAAPAKTKPNKIVTTTRPLAAGSATTMPLDPYGAPEKPVPKSDKPKPPGGTQSMPNPY
ncbi:MAG TPA: serine/threonine-protein kinase [Kofleriaceae bacterium]|nr:serine/threonine-protein kinase [Kofleriaceae bacterium]